MCVKAGFWVWLAIATTSAALAAQDAEQPEKGEQIMSARCLSCHDLRPIQVQALDKDAWAELVEAMNQKGAEVAKDDVPVLVDYLVRNHGPLPDGAGKKILLNRCTLCHDLKRVLRHGATPEVWEDTLSAMLNEGAMLTDEEFPVLLSYLASHFKPE
jgi:mono/diheme cytochrome c family protein